MSPHFLEMAVGVLVAIEAVLFGVFGFVISVFTTYAAAANSNPNNPTLPPIASESRSLCRWISYAIVADTLVAYIALYFIWPDSIWGKVLAVAIILSLLLLAVISWRLSRMM